MENQLKKQFEFTLMIEADTFEEAKTRAINIFGIQIYNKKVFWKQVFKPKKEEFKFKRDEYLGVEL